jgi:hypothetical protein
VPVMAGATPSLTLVAIEKLPLKFAAGVNVTHASSALTPGNHGHGSSQHIGTASNTSAQTREIGDY